MRSDEILKSKETYDKDYPTVSLSDAKESMIEFAKENAIRIIKKLSKTEAEYQRNIQYLVPLNEIK